jgi:hypothetical protein
MIEPRGPVPAIFQAAVDRPICVVMNVSIEGGRNRDGTRQPAGNGAGAEQRLTELSPAGVAELRWNAGVEALAARWQAALGGFHHTGAPPSR